MFLSSGTGGNCFVNMVIKHENQCHAVKILTNIIILNSQ
jgi:hypothetical protein